VTRIAGLVGLLVACSGPGKVESQPERRPEPQPGPPPAIVAEAERWGSRAVAALDACDKSALEDLFDFEATMRTAIGDEVPAGAYGLLGVMFDQMCAATLGGTYKVMKVTVQDGEMRVRLRLVGAGGSNYTEWSLARAPGAQPLRAHDGYFYATGQRLSEAMRDAAEAMDASSQGKQAVALQIARLQQLIAAGHHDEALAALEQLDTKLRDSRMGHLLRIRLTAGASDRAFEDAIAAYDQAFPDDPTLDMTVIDGYQRRGNWAKALAAVERLERRLGTDGHWRTMAASMLWHAGKHAEARAAVERALQLEPDLAEARAMRDAIAGDQGAGAVQPGPGKPSGSP
jgi:tetratricopeptide (TPR) repeat protein